MDCIIKGYDDKGNEVYSQRTTLFNLDDVKNEIEWAAATGLHRIVVQVKVDLAL